MSHYKPFADERLLVASTVVTLSSGYWARSQKVILTCEGADLRFRVTGLAPSTIAGHYFYAAQSNELYGYNEISQFKAVGATTSTSAYIFVTYCS